VVGLDRGGGSHGRGGGKGGRGEKEAAVGAVGLARAPQQNYGESLPHRGGAVVGGISRRRLNGHEPELEEKRMSVRSSFNGREESSVHRL